MNLKKLTDEEFDIYVAALVIREEISKQERDQLMKEIKAANKETDRRYRG